MSTQRIDRNDKRALLARFKAPSDLPLEVSGIVAEVVRPPLAWWVSVGEVPESLFNAAEGQRLGEAEAVRRWPESEGWRGHTVSVREDREHSRCIVAPDVAATFAALAGSGRDALEDAPAVETQAQELETVA